MTSIRTKTVLLEASAVRYFRSWKSCSARSCSSAARVA
jgi:hypothetical protein